MEHAQVGTEELAGLGEGIDAPLDEEIGQYLVNPQFLCQLADGGRISLLFDDPFLLDSHKKVCSVRKDNNFVGLSTKKVLTL